MSVKNIVNHILSGAQSGKESALQEAKVQAADIVERAGKEAEAVYQDIFNKGKQKAENNKNQLVVNARLEAKKKMLAAKQDIIGRIFGEIKKQGIAGKVKKEVIYIDKVSQAEQDVDFYLDKIRLEHEAALAEILFK